MVVKASSDAFFFAPLSLTHYLFRTISRRRGAQRLTQAASALNPRPQSVQFESTSIAYPASIRCGEVALQ